MAYRGGQTARTMMRCFLNCLVRRFEASACCRVGSNQEGDAGEQEMSCNVVDHIDLAGVKAGFERTERKIELKYASLAVTSIQFREFDRRTFENPRIPSKKRNIGEQMNVRSASPWRRAGRFVDFVVEPQVLRC